MNSGQFCQKVGNFVEIICLELMMQESKLMVFEKFLPFIFKKIKILISKKEHVLETTLNIQSNKILIRFSFFHFFK